MSLCADEFTISDGVANVVIKNASVSDGYQIARETPADGQDRFLAADGTAVLFVRYERTTWTITGSGLASVADLYTLDIKKSPWTVTIRGFSDGSAEEIWSVLPARPRYSRNRRALSHSWTLTLESAAAV